MPRFQTITFADGTSITPQSAAESVTAKRRLARERREAEGRVSIAEQQAEAKSQGLSRTGGVYTERFGQRKAREAGQNTAFGGLESFSGYFDNLGTYSPPSGVNVSREDKLAYDLSYTKKALALSAQETASIRKGVGAEQEKMTLAQTQDTAREKGEKTKFSLDGLLDGENTTTNPEYAKMTENQKAINKQRKESGQSFVPEKISASSGRSPIKDKLSKGEKMSAQNLSQTVNALGGDSFDVLAQNIDLMPKSQQGAMREYLRTQAASRAEAQVQEISQNVTEGIRAEEKKIRAELNLTENEELTFDENGQPLINGKTESERATDRAKKDVAEATEKYLEAANKDHDNEMARIRSMYTVDGVVTDKGLQKLADKERDFEEGRDEKLEEIDEKYDEFKAQQESRQADVDAKIAEEKSPEALARKEAAQEMADGAYKIQLEMAARGVRMGFTTALATYKKRQKTDELTNKEVANLLDEKILAPGFDRALALETAVEEFGDDISAATTWMNSRGFLKSEIKTQKEQYQKDVLGYTDEEIAEEKDDATIGDILRKSIDGDELTAKDLEKLENFEAGSPQKAERWKMKILYPDLSEEEIYKTVQEKFSTAKGSKGSEKKTEEDGTPTYNAAQRDVLSLLDEGDISPETVESFLRENKTYYDLTEAEIADLKRKFVVYDSSSQEYVRRDGDLEFNDIDDIAIEATGKKFSTLSPAEKVRLRKVLDTEALQGGVSKAKGVEQGKYYPKMNFGIPNPFSFLGKKKTPSFKEYKEKDKDYEEALMKMRAISNPAQ